MAWPTPQTSILIISGFQIHSHCFLIMFWTHKPNCIMELFPKPKIWCQILLIVGVSQLVFVINKPKNFRIDNYVIVSADVTIIIVSRCKTFTHNLVSCNIHTERLSYYCRKIRYQSLQVIRDSGIWYVKATNSVLTQSTCHFTLPSHLKHCPETSNALLFINHTASNEPDFVYELHEFAYWELNLWGREIHRLAFLP